MSTEHEYWVSCSLWSHGRFVHAHLSYYSQWRSSKSGSSIMIVSHLQNTLDIGNKTLSLLVLHREIKTATLLNASIHFRTFTSIGQSTAEYLFPEIKYHIRNMKRETGRICLLEKLSACVQLTAWGNMVRGIEKLGFYNKEARRHMRLQDIKTRVCQKDSLRRRWGGWSRWVKADLPVARWLATTAV